MLGNTWFKHTVFVFLTPDNMQDLLPIAKGKSSWLSLPNTRSQLSSRWTRTQSVQCLFSECFGLYFIHLTHTYLTYILFIGHGIIQILLLSILWKHESSLLSCFVEPLFNWNPGFVPRGLFLVARKVKVTDV